MLGTSVPRPLPPLVWPGDAGEQARLKGKAELTEPGTDGIGNCSFPSAGQSCTLENPIL